MNDAQAHRGPDDSGLWVRDFPAGSLAFGHRRLSILDLSAAGHQPMVKPETGDCLVYNGEIYNYPALRAELEAGGAVFQSHCDTEAILHAFARWGPDAFDRFDGMFALALYDQRERRLILARDPLGIKPLYYARTPRAFLFGSELRTIEASGLVDPAIDRRALASALAYGAVPGPLTMLREVQLLDPGTWASLDLGSTDHPSLRTTRYWDFPTPRCHGTAGDAEVCDTMQTLVNSAVRSHLMSDVPVGVFLSSGLDSTAIAVLAAEARGGDIDTFTVSRQGDRSDDEGPIARETARRLGTRHHQIDLSDSGALLQAENWMRSLDQPSVDGLNTYIISQAVRERGIIVALSGLGGDEIFGGYSSFRQVPWLAKLARVTGGVPRGVRREVARLLYRGGSKSQREKVVELAGGSASLPSLYFRRRRLLSDLELTALGMDSGALGLDEGYLPAESEPERSLARHDSVASIGVLESRFYMGNMLLRDSDVFGMAHGLELRVPLLDRRLAEYALSQPGALRVVRGGPNKPLLANALGVRLPADLLKLKKRGFSLPQSRWMAGPLRDLFESLIQVVEQSGLVHPAGARSIWQGFLDEPDGTAWSRAWFLGALGSWLERRPAGWG